MSSWDGADLEARLRYALDVARKTINYFGIHGYTDQASPALSFGPEKPLAETAMLMYAASACGQRADIGRRVDELAGLLVPLARARRVLVDIALHPALAWKFAVPHVLLTRLGYPDAGFDDFLRSCITSQASNGHDRAPTASAERTWISSLWAGGNSEASWRADLRNSLLKWPIDILGGLRDDAYALTHLIFYCTDFGFRTRRWPRRRSLVLNEASSLLARYLDAEDYDLAGEVLLAWPFTGAAWGATAAFGFRVLASVEDQAGSLPCGNIDAARLARLDGEERTRYALGTAYHTAYVMGFVSAACLRPGRAPPVAIVGREYDELCLGELLLKVRDDQGHWQSEFATLTPAEQRRLTPFVLDVAIVQACRRHDYEAVKEILSLGSTYGIASSPMCHQAAELLERIASCAIAIDGRRQATATMSGCGKEALAGWSRDSSPSVA